MRTAGHDDDRRFALDELEQRLLLSAVLTTAIPDQQVYASGGTAAIDLNNFFDEPDIPSTVVRYDTVFGEFDVELFDVDTPNTVTNFLGYVDRGDYDDTFFHRLALNDIVTNPGLDPTLDGTPFILQGGGFEFSAPNNYDSIFQGPSVVNEFGRSNLRGTIAMAKLGGDPDSATNQWFFNMGDNSANLDNQNGGFTVFGQVLGNGMDIVDLIAQTPVWNALSLNGAFSDLPLRNFDNTSFPDESNLAVINSITRVDELTYRFVQSSSPTRLLGVVDDQGVLTISTVGLTKPETITLTVEAEDSDGNTAQRTITVNVTPAKESLTNDRNADLLWRNFKKGRNTLWQMRGFDREASTALNKVGNTTWFIAATGDFNNDGNNDLLWRNAFDGQNKIWLMNGTTRIGTVDLRTVASQNQSIGGVADFNNDGKNDILWHNSRNGKNVVWTMDGAVEDGTIRLGNQNGAEWYVGGVADIDQNGATDIIWRNDSGGQNKVWLLNPFDASLKQATSLPTLADTDWVIGGVADYSSDRNYDILWRNTTTGKQRVWVMNGTNRVSINNDIPTLRNQDWQLPGRASQLAARDKALSKIQRQKNRTARLRTASQASSAAAVAASVRASQSSTSLLSEAETIFSIDLGNTDQGAEFTNN
jgi:cyclophilin family peptidyl-prolyl cis-trans isomerase